MFNNLYFSKMNLKKGLCNYKVSSRDIYPTPHKVRFDKESFYGGEPRTHRNSCAAIRKKMLGPVGIIFGGRLRRRAVNSPPLSSYYLEIIHLANLLLGGYPHTHFAWGYPLL